MLHGTFSLGHGSAKFYDVLNVPGLQGCGAGHGVEYRNLSRKIVVSDVSPAEHSTWPADPSHSPMTSCLRLIKGCDIPRPGILLPTD